MKRTWTLLLMVILATVPLLAANITVGSPAAGATLEIGKSLPIAWTFAGLANSTKVTISLWQGASKLGNIIEDLAIGSAGQGSTNWTAGVYTGGTAAAGNDYFVKFRTGDGSVTGKSGLFTLAAKPGGTGGTLPITTLPGKANSTIGIKDAPPCLTVTSPKAGDTATPYNVVYVNWIQSSGQDANVSVQLLRSGKLRMRPIMLAVSTPNNGAFNWDPKALAPAPGIYRIRVRTLDGKCEALSGEFTMQELGGIEILSPKGGEVWESGSSHAVTWKRLGNIQTLEILLNREGSWTHTLAQGVAATLGSKTCIFVRGDTDGTDPHCYKVFINHSGGNTVKPSGCITLTGNPDLAVSASWTPTMASVGTNLTFTIKVENKGLVHSQACQGDFHVNGAVDQSFPVPAIDPGTIATITRIWKLACPGTVKIIIDPGQLNVEADKANNVWEKPLCTN